MRLVGGADVSFAPGRPARARAAVVVLVFPELTLVEVRTATAPVTFPYVPGLLSFREAPVVLRAFRALRRKPQVLLCDGHGEAHPRRFGLACHLGLLAGVPTIGVAKHRLVGVSPPLPSARGAWAPLTDGGEVVGAVVRTRRGVRPVYVSVGHRVVLPRAVELVLDCAPRFRLPEPLRLAHQAAAGRSPASLTSRPARP